MGRTWRFDSENDFKTGKHRRAKVNEIQDKESLEDYAAYFASDPEISFTGVNVIAARQAVSTAFIYF
jgi:hypothetical protein